MKEMNNQLPCKAKIGDCLELFGPISWFQIMHCLIWLRESCDVRLPFIFKRWEKVSAVLDERVGEPHYQAWKARLTAIAEGEFSFRYNVLLSDNIEAAQNKAAAKQDAAGKVKILEECKATICKYAPPSSFPGGGR
jgi:hypothetical protein